MAYFARRTADPQTAADLTADTFVAAITSFGGFDSSRGTARAWLLGIARRVFAQHCEAVTRGRDVVVRMTGRRALSGDEIDDLVGRIDAERAGRDLVAALSALPALDREVIELVDVVGMTPKEAAAVLGVSSGAVRIRLFRVRGKIRDLAAGGGQR
jgi:RNA polymerase sigma-70 factor (ECF subfamily)